MTYETREPGRIGALGYALMFAAAVGLAALVLHQFAALLDKHKDLDSIPSEPWA